MFKHLKLGIMILIVLIFTAACSSSESEKSKEPVAEKGKVELTISAAASLKDAMDVIQASYEDEHPEVTLTFNFGGSGSLQQQISQGAPVDLFFSAAEDKFDLLVAEGMITKDNSIDLLGNELVLIVPEEDTTIKSFSDLTKENVSKISIGTPEIVPAGAYGKEALETMNLWNEVESNIVYAKDVRQVLSYVETGNVSAGIVYKTDALLTDKVKIIATAEADTHTPIIYPVGIINDSKNYDATKEFYEYLQSDETIEIFEDYGFTAQ
ncbi:molybdate ABC transporter substrate-binding protein [Cytobacillus purgationiresistens]|uniref:Molybdate transport system substrate-binding protein n=1 Tax=Cytobacillus purgationiresistens TaxID=863449 RepID=A0ABU0APJ5_9BACI|nr:molybdate ABC transporter substrate-binding protein [Cytobacillus purgationiresistens]MDQ0272692.1 molybdate transport system substrate-binding protein [Cytobacillus purgationiresistens]